MTPDQFFAKFALLSETPNAVAKMRELILDLAVRGKLVPQDPTDEPASAILRLIEEDVASAVKNRKLRNPKPIGSYEGEIPLELPEGWEISQLGSLTSPEDNAICDGPFGSKLKTEHYIQTPGYAVIRLGNIGVGYFIWGKEGHISQEHYLSLSSNHVKAGDLIVAGLADPLVRCCEVPKQLGPAVNKADCFRVRVHPSVDRTYVRHYLNSSIAKAFAAEENHGITRERINLSNAKALPVPLPPLAEQKRIVAKVDELMALCDQLESQQKQRETKKATLVQAALTRFADAPTPGNLEFLFHKAYSIEPAQLRESILALAFQGRLTAPEPHDQCVQALLTEIAAEKEDLIQQSLLKRSDSISLDPSQELPWTLPVGWLSVSLSSICTSVTDGDHLPPPKTDQGVPFLVIGNVRWGGIDFSDCRYVGHDYYNELSPIRKPRQRDILYTLVGSFGIPVIVDTDHQFCIQRHIGILRPSVHINHHFLAYCLRSKLVFDQVATCATGIAQKTVPLSGLRRVAIPLPPLAEQKRIVAKVDELMALVDKLEVQLAASRDAGAKLIEAVVAELARAA